MNCCLGAYCVIVIGVEICDDDLSPRCCIFSVLDFRVSGVLLEKVWKHLRYVEKAQRKFIKEVEEAFESAGKHVIEFYE